VNNVVHSDVLCVDSVGRVCITGRHFIRAEDEKTYPIGVFRIQPHDPTLEMPKASSAVGNDAPLAEFEENMK
jgi:hypothetical protein